MLRRSNPAGVCAPMGPYHQVVTVPAGSELAFLAGQIGVYPDGRDVSDDPAEQARQTFANVGTIVRGLGATPTDIAKFTVYLVGAENLPAFRSARTEVFADWYPSGGEPASTLVVVAGLASPEIVVEIEAIVALPAA